MGGGDWSHTTSVIPPRFIEMNVTSQKRLHWRIHVLAVSIMLCFCMIFY